jgi:hypothetical protein
MRLADVQVDLVVHTGATDQEEHNDSDEEEERKYSAVVAGA